MKGSGNIHEKLMSRAMTLAGRGSGWVNPNPLVGAVLWKEGRIIGEGYHEFYGGAHAEVNALRNATEPVNGSTLVITLEPCIHKGKTPPCAPLIAEKGISEVVIGMRDPNPVVNGKGIDYLRSHRINVIMGVKEKEIREQNERFIKFITTRKPFCILKTAMTLDGKIATVTGESKWITGEKSRRCVHKLRHQVSAIMTGSETVIHDNPMLNVRRKGKRSRNPLKIVVDSKGRTPVDSNILKYEPQLTIIATIIREEDRNLKQFRRMGAEVIVCPEKNGRVDLVWLFGALGAMEIDSVMIESGGTLAFSALEDGMVDKIEAFIAPMLIGGRMAPSPVDGNGFHQIDQALQIERMKIKKLGGDILIEGYIKKQQ